MCSMTRARCAGTSRSMSMVRRSRIARGLPIRSARGTRYTCSRHSRAVEGGEMSDRIFVGTRKGLFELVRTRNGWDVADLRFLGDPVTAVLADAEGGIWTGLDLG